MKPSFFFEQLGIYALKKSIFSTVILGITLVYRYEIGKNNSFNFQKTKTNIYFKRKKKPLIFDEEYTERKKAKKGGE